MEKLTRLKNQINQLSERLKQNKRQIKADKKQIKQAKKNNLEFKQVLAERNLLIDKVNKAELELEQLIQKIEKMNL